MTEQNLSKNYNKISSKDDIDLGTLTEKLLESEEIKKLPEDQQGVAIAGRFIGSVVRQGEVEIGRGDKIDARTALVMVQEAVTKPELEDWSTAITRSNGLRSAALALAGDKRTVQLLGGLVENLRSTREPESSDRELTLTSLQQMEGYLYADTAANRAASGAASDWPSVLMVRADESVNQGHDWINGQTDMAYLENDYIRRSGQEWNGAVDAAKQAGVDMDLLSRSVEHIRGLPANELAGRSALVGSLDPDQFNHLFDE